MSFPTQNNVHLDFPGISYSGVCFGMLTADSDQVQRPAADVVIGSSDHVAVGKSLEQVNSVDIQYNIL